MSEEVTVVVVQLSTFISSPNFKVFLLVSLARSSVSFLLATLSGMDSLGFTHWLWLSTRSEATIYLFYFTPQAIPLVWLKCSIGSFIWILEEPPLLKSTLKNSDVDQSDSYRALCNDVRVPSQQGTLEN